MTEHGDNLRAGVPEKDAGLPKLVPRDVSVVNLPDKGTLAKETSNTVQSGIILPSDIRIRLVRAEAASLDTILSFLYSTMLSVFGVFLGIVLTKGKQSMVTEIASVVCFGAFAVALLSWWIVTVHGVNRIIREASLSVAE
jgi:hypothetical protein